LKQQEYSLAWCLGTVVALLFTGIVIAGEWDPIGSTGSNGGQYTRATNSGSIVNTRHNLTQSFAEPGLQYFMDGYRNHYEAVCVYCHTPHGASGTVDAPLWNRTVNDVGVYTLYTSNSITQIVEPPGPNSLTCLSCHDGTIAIDSIINMPGSGQYKASQETSVDNAFLDQWENRPSYLQGGFGAFCGDSPCFHSVLGSEGNTGEQGGTCMECHYKGNNFDLPDFAVFVIGQDLTNDHPVGVLYPDPNVYDFVPGMVAQANASFFDNDGDSRMDNNELRVYDSGDGPRVECASCHDPHGVESAGDGSKFIASFLRVDSDGSQICLSCHIK
jgi:cytochrome c553